MSPDERGQAERGQADLEQVLRQALGARASMVQAEPDVDDLTRRIERAAHRVERRGRVFLAAAVLAAAAVVGGSLGAFIVPIRTQHLLLSSNANNQGGSLPTGPSQSGRGHPQTAKGGRSDSPMDALVQPALYIDRTTAAGTHLVARGTWLNPVAVVSGASLDGCYSHELVTTTASKGTAVGAATGVVGVQPLATNGLEVVNSGAVPASGGLDVWWATVAVGSAVARVAAEEPDGGTDAMKPDNGIAVLGGLTPQAVTSDFFSVVAEDASGQSLHSIGFLTGWGPKVIGASAGDYSSATAAATANATTGCMTTGTADQQVTTLGSQPAAPLLATESVVSAFHQAFTFGSPTGVQGSLAAVAGGSSLDAPARGASFGFIAAPRAASAVVSSAAAASEVKVARVSFLTASEAEVVYRTGDGPWWTGVATATASGLWQVTRNTFCGAVLNGLPATDGLTTTLVRACQEVSG